MSPFRKIDSQYQNKYVKNVTVLNTELDTLRDIYCSFAAQLYCIF